jgi:hypothetical protein
MRICQKYKERGNEHYKQDNFEKAIKYYSKCIEIDAENIDAYLNRSL